MWHTPEGTRALAGKELGLVARAIVSMVEEMREYMELDEEWEVGIPVVDAMEADRRPFLLLFVGESLVGPGEKSELFAWNEGLVGAIFRFVRCQIDMELDEEGEAHEKWNTIWRKSVHDAWSEKILPEVAGENWDADEGPKQALNSTNHEEWGFKVTGLEELILHDPDFETEQLMDLPPQKADEIKKIVGIREDHFSAIPPLLDDADKSRLKAFLTQLEGSLDEDSA